MRLKTLIAFQKSRQAERNRYRLAEPAERMLFAAIGAATSYRYGEVRAYLESLGTPIGANDLWIAAQALTLGAVFVTDNIGEFSRVPGLKVENWLERDGPSP